MPDTSSVLNRFAAYSKVDTEDLEKYELLCEESLEDILSELKDNVNPSEHRIKITCMSAALAFYKYVLQQDSFSEKDNVTLGSLKVNSNTSIAPESAYRFYIQTRVSASDILKDDDFFAGKVTIV